MNRAPLRPYLVLFSSVAVMSTASILIRLAQAEGIPSLIIASGRLGLAVLLLTPVAWSRAGAELRGLCRRDMLLALLSGVCLGTHFAAWITSLAYTWLAFGTAAVLLTVAAAASGKPFWGYAPSSYIWVVALAIGPQLIGHTAVNWALRHLTATLIAVAILGEPIGSSLLALALFNETFTELQLVGLFFLFCGILAAILSEARTAKR